MLRRPILMAALIVIGTSAHGGDLSAASLLAQTSKDIICVAQDREAVSMIVDTSIDYIMADYPFEPISLACREMVGESTTSSFAVSNVRVDQQLGEAGR